MTATLVFFFSDIGDGVYLLTFQGSRLRTWQISRIAFKPGDHEEKLKRFFEARD
jgi:hypothetical protein